MLKNYVICLLIGIFTIACATFNDKNEAPAANTSAASEPQQEPPEHDEFKDSDSVSIPDWRPFKGVLLRNIVANCCFSESQNTVILGQDTNGDQAVDKCYQLKGKEGDLYYRTLACPEKLVPVKPPQKEKFLHCNLTRASRN